LFSIKTPKPTTNWVATGLHILKMGLWGIPGILLAFALNYAFNEILVWNVYFSYLLVLLIITSINYFVIDGIVFKGKKSNSRQKRITAYALVVFVAKALEWGFYSSLIWTFEIHYLIVQLITSVIFLFVKFFLFKNIMR